MALDGSTDRRARRTRTLVNDALTDLILERGYDRVTVQDILDRADIGRSTFYNHYPSKDDLLLRRLEEVEADVEARISSGVHQNQGPDSSLMSPLLPLFEHADENRPLCRAMLASGRATTLTVRSGRTFLHDVLVAHLRDRSGVSDTECLDVAVDFALNAMIGVLTQWLESEPHHSATTVFADFDTMASAGIRAYLHRQD
jgi:AcrR family transcriptional regulator